MKVMLIDTPADPVRFGFTHLFTKRPGMKNQDGSTSEAKYELTPIIVPGGDNARKVEEAIVAVAKEKWGDNWREIYNEFADDQKGLRKGDSKRSQSGETYDGFAGNLFVTARNTNRPGVFSRAATPVVEGDDGAPYSGCYGNVEIDVWALKKQGVKKRIVIDLLGAQKTRDGDAFGAGSAPSKASAFANLSAADDADEKPKATSLLG